MTLEDERLRAARADHALVTRQLKRRKVGDRKYHVMWGGEVIATAAQTGERGRDDYPWDVYGDALPYMPACETLAQCLERVATEIIKRRTS